MREAEERQLVVSIARTWLRTPFHHRTGLKGVGVDCAFLVCRAFEEAALIPKVDIPYYPNDWHLHQSAERYMALIISKHAAEVPPPPARQPLPGDVVLFRFGKCFSHGAIVVAWPQIIHAYVGRGCEYEDVGRAEWLHTIGEGSEKGKPRPMRFFSFWARTPAAA